MKNKLTSIFGVKKWDIGTIIVLSVQSILALCALTEGIIERCVVAILIGIGIALLVFLTCIGGTKNN